VAERNGFGELLCALDLVELLFDGLPELGVINVFENEDGLDDLAELFRGAIERVLFLSLSRRSQGD